MTKANGSIGYIEHRSPKKDETGEYIIRPMFVAKDEYSYEDMAKEVERDFLTTKTQFMAAMSAAYKETMLALADGKSVKLDEMFTLRPKLRVRKHTDDNGNEYTYTPIKTISPDGKNISIGANSYVFRIKSGY